MINKESLDKFKMLYKEKFDVELTDEGATKMATDFLNLMKVLLRPEPKNEEKKQNLSIEQHYETK